MLKNELEGRDPERLHNVSKSYELLVLGVGYSPKIHWL